MRLLFVLLLIAAAVAAACDDRASEIDVTPQNDGSPYPEPTLAPPTATIEATTATVRLLQPGGSISAGSTFTVIVRIIGATNLGAYQLSPTYDRAVLELTGIRDGGWLGSTGRTPNCKQEVSAEPPFYCGTFGNAQLPGPSGSGDLALLEFRALVADETVVGLGEIVVTMPDARDIPTIVEPATVTVAP